MLSNAYFLAKFRFDTAENEPAKKFQKLSKNFYQGTPTARQATEELRAPQRISEYTYQPRVIRIAKIVRLEKEVDISFLTGFFLPPFSIIPVDQPF